MVWGSMGGPDGPARQDRAAGLSVDRVDKDALRTAQQMEQAGLKWRPSMVPSIAWVVLGLVVLTVVYVYVR
jgi:hypothetical protein